MKPLNLPKESQEALLNGASMFILYCEITLKQLVSILIDFIFSTLGTNYEIYKLSPYQTSDEVLLPNGDIAIIKDVKVIKVQKIPWNIKLNILTGYDLENQKHNIFIEPLFKDWYNKQYGNYKDNPYVFLYEIERTNK